MGGFYPPPPPVLKVPVDTSGGNVAPPRLFQERLILASNHFRTSLEIEQLREHRRLIQRIPEPVLVSGPADEGNPTGPFV